MQKSIRLITGLYLKLTLLAVAVGLLLRIVLLFNEQTSDLSFSLGEWSKIFLLGAINDLCAATIGFLFIMLFALTLTHGKYRKPWGYIILGVLIAGLCYVALFNTIFDKYGSVVQQFAAGILAYWTITFGLRLFSTGFRRYWPTIWFALIITIHVGLIVLNGVSEFFFWNEFGVRYNFMAVDYLTHMSGASGNIMESYPILPMTLGIVLVTLLITWYCFRRDIIRADTLRDWHWKTVVGPAYAVAVLLSVGVLHFNVRFQDSPNVYANELQANGLYKFYEAFVKHSLDDKQFYHTHPDDNADTDRHANYDSTTDNGRTIRDEQPK